MRHRKSVLYSQVRCKGTHFNKEKGSGLKNVRYNREFVSVEFAINGVVCMPLLEHHRHYIDSFVIESSYKNYLKTGNCMTSVGLPT